MRIFSCLERPSPAFFDCPIGPDEAVRGAADFFGGEDRRKFSRNYHDSGNIWQGGIGGRAPKKLPDTALVRGNRQHPATTISENGFKAGRLLFSRSLIGKMIPWQNNSLF